MTTPITDEISMQVYGDEKLQERLIKLLAESFNTEVTVSGEKEYETKKGRTGHYMSVKLKLSE